VSIAGVGVPILLDGTTAATGWSVIYHDLKSQTTDSSTIVAKVSPKAFKYPPE
jgi:hypothetical protein